MDDELGDARMIGQVIEARRRWMSRHGKLAVAVPSHPLTLGPNKNSLAIHLDALVPEYFSSF